MRLTAARFAEVWVRDAVASWENEGGAIRTGGPRPQRADAPAWPPASSVVESRSAEARGADRGIADTHALTMLRTSLLLLIPALGVIAIFWAASAPQ
jgi:hypothetical protein